MLIKDKIFNTPAAGQKEVLDEMLGKINKFSQRPLSADDVFVQKYIIAHNGVDRDRERFPEDLLEDFARTLPGKSFLEVHDKSRLPIGRFFDAVTEEMSPGQFQVLTGEDIRLPDSVKAAKIVFGWTYLLKKDFNQKLIDNLEAGVYSHVSIGFSAADLKPVKGEFDQILYFEYSAPGEAREASIVYLGAQQGAIATKSAAGTGCREKEIDWSDPGQNPLIPGSPAQKDFAGHDDKLSFDKPLIDEKYNPAWEEAENNPLIPSAGKKDNAGRVKERFENNDYLDLDKEYDAAWETPEKNPLIPK